MPFLDFRALTGVQKALWDSQLEPLTLEQKGMCTCAWVRVRVCRGYGRLGFAILSRVIRKSLTDRVKFESRPKGEMGQTACTGGNVLVK